MHKAYNEANCRIILTVGALIVRKFRAAFLSCLNVPQARVIQPLCSLYQDSCCAVMTQ